MWLMKKFICTVGAIMVTLFNAYGEDLVVLTTNAETGMNNGAIDLTISGGAAPFLVNWVGPDGFTSSEEDLVELAPGTYTVTVTDSWCGVATLNVVIEEEDLGAGITAENDFPLLVYPNPTHGGVYLVSDLVLDLVVYNMLGEIVLTKKSVDYVDLGNQPTGIYMLQLTSSMGTVTRKITLK